MSGFSTITGEESIMFTDNVSFDGTKRGGKVTTDGQLLIGSTVAPHIRVGTISAGSGVTITNASGAITIAASGGGYTWTDATSASYTLAAQNGYVANRGGGVTFNLPPSGTLGDTISIIGKSGLWTISQNANQRISIGNVNSTIGVGGSVTATDAGDCISLVCITAGASTVWRARYLVGNLTIV